MNRLLLPLFLLAAALLCPGQGAPNALANELVAIEHAALAAIEARLAEKDYSAAQTQAQTFLADFPRSRKAALVNFYLGLSFEHQQKTEEAIAFYSRAWSAHKGNIRASAPAMLHYMQLLWARNQPAQGNAMRDRQAAYVCGAMYIEQTKSISDRFTPEDLALWKAVEKLADQYAADPSIKTLENLRRR